MKKFLKALAVVLCAAILVAGSVTATIAYLATKTDPVQNTFVAGDINITLTPASTNNDTMIPGMDIAKNPSVTVTAGSVDCWLFVKVTEENGYANYMTYAVDTDATKWQALDGEPGVYYRYVRSEDAGNALNILKDNKVTVRSDLTKAECNAITNAPGLSFTAYAVQYANFDLGTTDHDVAAAWAIAKALENPSANS